MKGPVSYVRVRHLRAEPGGDRGHAPNPRDGGSVQGPVPEPHGVLGVAPRRYKFYGMHGLNNDRTSNPTVFRRVEITVALKDDERTRSAKSAPRPRLAKSKTQFAAIRATTAGLVHYPHRKRLSSECRTRPFPSYEFAPKRAKAFFSPFDQSSRRRMTSCPTRTGDSCLPNAKSRARSL